MSTLILVSIGFGLGLVVSSIGLLILLCKLFRKPDFKWDNKHYRKIKIKDK